MQSRLERLEEAEKRHRDQLRNERLKREEAERRLYTDRQGSIKKNIRSIMVMSPSPSTPLRSGTGAGEEAHDSALLQQQHLRKCLTEAEGAIQKLECDLLRELDARQQLERAVSNSNSNGGEEGSALKKKETPLAGENWKDLSTPPPTASASSLLYGNSASAMRERQMADESDRLRERLKDVSSQLEAERTLHAATKEKLSESSSHAVEGRGGKAASVFSPLGPDDDKEHIRVPRNTMQTIREQLISLSAERDALLAIGDGSQMTLKALSEVAESPSMIAKVKDMHANAAGSGQEDSGASPFAVGRLTEILRSKELIHLKLVEALRQEKAKTSAMEALLSEYHDAEERYRESEESISKLRKELRERDNSEESLRETVAALERQNAVGRSDGGANAVAFAVDAEVNELREKLAVETEEKRQAVNERDKAQTEAAEMRENLNEMVGELYQYKEMVNSLEKTNKNAVEDDNRVGSAHRKGSFAF